MSNLLVKWAVKKKAKLAKWASLRLRLTAKQIKILRAASYVGTEEKLLVLQMLVDPEVIHFVEKFYIATQISLTVTSSLMIRSTDVSGDQL